MNTLTTREAHLKDLVARPEPMQRWALIDLLVENAMTIERQSLAIESLHGRVTDQIRTEAAALTAVTPRLEVNPYNALSMDARVTEVRVGVASANPPLPKIADDHRCAARSRPPASYTTSGDTT